MWTSSDSVTLTSALPLPEIRACRVLLRSWFARYSPEPEISSSCSTTSPVTVILPDPLILTLNRSAWIVVAVTVPEPETSSPVSLADGQAVDDRRPGSQSRVGPDTQVQRVARNLAREQREEVVISFEGQRLGTSLLDNELARASQLDIAEATDRPVLGRGG